MPSLSDELSLQTRLQKCWYFLEDCAPSFGTILIFYIQFSHLLLATAILLSFCKSHFASLGISRYQLHDDNENKIISPQIGLVIEFNESSFHDRHNARLLFPSTILSLSNFFLFFFNYLATIAQGIRSAPLKTPEHFLSILLIVEPDLTRRQLAFTLNHCRLS